MARYKKSHHKRTRHHNHDDGDEHPVLSANERTLEKQIAVWQASATSSLVGGGEEILLVNPLNKPAKVTSATGERRSDGPHNGTDFAPTDGSAEADVVAIASGQVLFAGKWDNRSGYAIIVGLDDKKTMVSYAHLAPGSLESGASVGLRVTQGEPIAKLGSSGNATGPSVHLTVRTLASSPKPAAPEQSRARQTVAMIDDDALTAQLNRAQLLPINYSVPQSAESVATQAAAVAPTPIILADMPSKNDFSWIRPEINGKSMVKGARVPASEAPAEPEVHWSSSIVIVDSPEPLKPNRTPLKPVVLPKPAKGQAIALADR